MLPCRAEVEPHSGGRSGWPRAEELHRSCLGRPLVLPFAAEVWLLSCFHIWQLDAAE